jgi:hypothetical protein
MTPMQGPQRAIPRDIKNARLADTASRVRKHPPLVYRYPFRILRTVNVRSSYLSELAHAHALASPVLHQGLVVSHADALRPAPARRHAGR